MTKRILLTGASGFVGGTAVAQAGPEFEVHALSRSAPGLEREGLSWRTLDPLDFGLLRATVQEIRPDAILHVAASANIDFCETNREEAERINVDLTKTLCDCGREIGAKMVFVSTDTVFCGERGNYSEEDATGPVNFYGETKVRAEEIVLETSPDAAIARVCLVMGIPVFGKGNSFLPKMLASLGKGEEVYVPGNEVRSPVDVITVSRALLEIASTHFKGIVHLAGNETMPRTEMAKRIATLRGYSPDLVIRKDSDALPGRAPRPANVGLNNAKAQAELRTPMLDLDEAIELIR